VYKQKKGSYVSKSTLKRNYEHEKSQ
jgi:hypothetical protein